MVGNAHRPRGPGKCHRKQTADRGFGREVRVKRCGKSAPRSGRPDWQGKPHREQNQAGRRGGPSRLTSGSVASAGEQSPRERNDRSRQNPAYRPTPLFTIHSTKIPSNTQAIHSSCFVNFTKDHTVRPSIQKASARGVAPHPASLLHYVLQLILASLIAW